MSLSSHDTVLHATPPFGGLPASDVESLYLAAVLQSALPGRWAIKSGEWATNGSKCGAALLGSIHGGAGGCKASLMRS